ncbi:DUF6151 family protein [Kiloniella litopenaei]|uniref:DUF6151 family protein n=1 Tax=Kiloniella litopenaei TaxID=1549748 RepID=UPI0006965316|nr:DUF6151 family protein [Kiloniella litopenaei]
MTDIPLKCTCGEVKGIARNISPHTARRVICYCQDCQDFARKLDRADDILNAFGGTDIIQITPSQVEITLGKDRLRYLKLSEKGIYRWYTDCCKTPAGNMIGPKFPFLGVVHNFIAQNDAPNDIRGKILGPVRYSIMEKDIIKPLVTPPPEMPRAEHSADKFPLGLMIKIFTRLFLDTLSGKNKPNPYFKPDGTPISE